MRDIKSDLCISSIIGTVLMLLIAVTTFSVIYFTVLSDEGPPHKIYVDIVGTVEGKNLILEHRGGDALDIDSEIEYSLAGEDKSILINDYLSVADKEDGKWNLGERIIIPFEYDIDKLDEYDEAELIAIDHESNSLAFLGNIELKPMSDIGVDIEVEPDSPVIEHDVTITISAECLSGDVGAIDIQIKCLLPDGLIHVSNSSSRGTYSNSTGIWYIDKLDIWETATLTITATVVPTEQREFTQIAMILDGSGSILSQNWTTMTTGLANAIEDPDIFPHDGTVELTVIQFGVYFGYSPKYCRVEISPTIVTESNFLSIANTIRYLSQGKGGTPMAAGIFLASDTLENSTNYDKDNRQIITLVTDGEPTYWSEEGPDRYVGQSDSGLVCNEKDKTSTVNATNYLIENLELTEDQDEFNALAVGVGPDVGWLNSSIVWPKPGYIWDNSIQLTPPGSGWVSQIGSWSEFTNAVNQIFNIIFNTIRTPVEIIKLYPTDPNAANDQITAIIVPQDE